MGKIAAAVVLYYPDRKFLKNLQTYLPLTDKLWVFDNSEKADEYIRAFLKNLGPKVFYFSDGLNKGIASRLNHAAQLAIEDGFDWLLTMDQDSFFEDNQLERYFTCVEQFDNCEDVAMFGVDFSENKIQTSNCSFKESNLIITSGSLINLNIFEKTGGFDEDLFIDEVDFEFCLKAVSKGLRIIQFTHIYLRHQLGVISQHRSLKNNRLTLRTLHSPIRLYYLTRNFLFLRNKYGESFKTDIEFKKNALLNRLKNNILYTKERWMVIKYIFRGWKDYRKKRMGKIDSH